MSLFNIYGFLCVLVILIPNIVFAVRCKDGFVNRWQNKTVEILEQIGRFGCFLFMILMIPGTCFLPWSATAWMLYLIIDAVCVLAYCVIWIVCFRKSSVFRALALSILPSVLFLASGILTRSILLTLFACIFAPTHILLSYKNAAAERMENRAKE